jgi:lipid A 3-O-deacylase
MSKKIILILFLTVSKYCWSQNRAFEVGIISDNDSYTSLINDKYYTNGLSIYYSYLNANSNPDIRKKTTTFRLNQSVYTPKIRNLKVISKVDRPPAGLAFAEIKRNYFYSNENVFKVGFQIGVVGPAALAEETQNVLHQIIKVDNVQGWQFQIKNTLLLQSNFMFSRKINAFDFAKNIDFHFQSESNFGTTLVGTTNGIAARISLKNLLPIYNSNFYGAALSADKSVYKTQKEAYFYVSSGLNFQLFDATIQGGIFDNLSPVTFALIPFRFVASAGFKYRKDNVNLSYSFIYQGKEAKSEKLTGYYYGSIGVGFLF